MKKLTTLLLAFTLVIVATAQQNFEVVTKNPTPGATITIEYMPRNTVLQGVKDFDAVAYLLEGALPLAKEIKLKQEGGIFRGTVKTNDTTRAVFFSFSKEEKRDNNNDEGYYTMLYDKKGAPVLGANQSIAQGLSNYGGIWGLKVNAQTAASFNEAEFANPAAKQKFYREYFTFLGQSKEEANKELLKSELAAFLQRKDLTETEMSSTRGFYERYLKDKDKSDAVLVSSKERFPNGRWKRDEAQQNFFKAATPEEKVKSYTEFVTNFGPFTKADDALLDNMLANIASAYTSKGNYEEAKKYIYQIKGNASKAGALNNLAWKLAGEGIANKPLDVKLGLE
ncbi:MAG: hypothetical protein EON98_14205, partial [Chitinophagaceae bacterium]